MFVVLAIRLAASHAGESGEARTRDGGLYDVKAGAKAARNLFAYSILYLFALFSTLLAEHLLGAPPLAGFVR
jgi:protoheme IX farnesyltransferase